MKFILAIISLSLILLSCEKDDLGIQLIDNECSTISRLNQVADFESEYGSSFLFRNINTNQQKEFKYNAAESSAVKFNDTILCTHLTFDQSATLSYKADDGDYIRYEVNQFYDNMNNFNFGIINQNLFLDGKVVSKVVHLNNIVRLAFVNDDSFMLSYFDHQGLLLGYDDLNGNQWLINNGSADIFYCEVEDNLNKFKETKEFELFQKLEREVLTYTDGFATTATFKKDFKNIFSTYLSEIANSCPEEKLLINQKADMYIRHKFSNIFTSNISLVPVFESATSDKKYTQITINLWYDRENVSLHDIVLIGNPSGIELSENTNPTPYVFHESISLNDYDFTEVYEFERNGKQLFFSYEIGIIAFTDHLDLLNYLKVE